MKKRFLFLLSLLIVTSCNFGVDHNKALEQSIHSAMKDEGKLDLNNVADFDWDTAHLFQPYTPQSMINEELGFTFKDPSDIKIRDDIFLLVFVHDHKAVQYVEVSRKYGELIPKSHETITPSNALFDVKRMN